MDDLATGGPIEPCSALIIGEEGCGLALPTACNCGRHGECGTPANITANIHGTVVGEKDIARIVREQVLQFNRRNGDGPDSA